MTIFSQILSLMRSFHVNSQLMAVIPSDQPYYKLRGPILITAFDVLQTSPHNPCNTVANQVHDTELMHLSTLLVI